MTVRIGGPRDAERGRRIVGLYDALVDSTWPVPHEELDLPTSFGTTHVRRSGPHGGTPLVLLHPASGSSAAWYRIVAPLAAEHPVLAIDTIGTAGRSVQTRPISDEADLAAWLDEVLDGLGLEAVHLIGFSEGGWLALVHASKTRTRERLRSLVLLEPGGALYSIRRRTLAKLVGWGISIAVWPSRKEERLRAFSAWLSPGVELTDAEIEWVLAVFGGFRQHLPTPKGLPDEELAKVSTRILLMLGSDSVISDPEALAERAARIFPDVEVEIVPGAGHGLPFQFPDLTSDRIVRFVDATRETTRT
ncbi:MAG: alpha/beta fold hydrolase [Actinomycetota bacterium]